MSSKEKFYITTAISYPNGPPHIGHAYEVMATDAIARFKRLDGYDVYFQTGTDEHGQKVQRAAEAKGVSPKDYVDGLAALFHQMADALNISYDRFIRTTEAAHTVSTQELWKRMEANGDIYLNKYAGWYSVRDEAFYAESETTVQPDGVRLGGQGTPVEWVEEESYFFRLTKYQDILLKHYADNPDFIAPRERLNEITSFVKGGLQDLSISRTTFTWGIPVPGNDKHIMYVWVDALNNYVTGCGFPDAKNPRWKYWPADV
ncbi:MAG: methionine--tRNA ligase, partial [Beijerinckiaceae bacterium]